MKATSQCPQGTLTQSAIDLLQKEKPTETEEVVDCLLRIVYKNRF